MREARIVFNLRLVDKELCEPNIEHVRIQRAPTIGVGNGLKKSLPRSLKSQSVTVLQGNVSPNAHTSTSMTVKQEPSENQLSHASQIQLYHTPLNLQILDFH